MEDPTISKMMTHLTRSKRLGFLAFFTLVLGAASAVLLSDARPSRADDETVLTGQEPGQKYDPIQANGVYFEGWDTPQVALVLSGLLNGYIEPCGCAGMDRMKGWLSRRHTLFAELAEKNWPVVAVDTGLITNGFGIQEELKFDMAVNAFRLMGYDAIGLSNNELRFPADVLLTYTVPANTHERSLFVSANVGVYGFTDLYTLPFKTIEVNGLRFCVTSVVFPDPSIDRDDNIKVEDPAKRLGIVLPRIEKEECDHNILIIHGTEDQAMELAEQFPQFDIILSGDSPAEPPAEPKITSKGQYLIEVGEKGKFLIVLGFYPDSTAPRYQRLALDSRFKRSEDIHSLMIGYQGILKEIITTRGYKGLGLGLIDAPEAAVQGGYVGSRKCQSCHEESYRTWTQNRHSRAWDSLSTVPPTADSADPPRDFDPECISCHVVGWQHRENFPYKGGFVDIEKTPHLANVGCESCHGPGSAHMAAEVGDDEQLQENLRAAMRLGDRAEKLCQSCHDENNSPNFEFEKYYEIIEHTDNPE